MALSSTAAASVALHRKGLSSLVLEKSETLGSHGVAIGVHANGWRALNNLASQQSSGRPPT